MKLAIIGGSPEENFSFIENSEIVKDYTQADVIIFLYPFNFRSAVTKFNKIPQDKLVIGIGNNGCDFLVKRYGGIPMKNYYIKPPFSNKSLPVHNGDIVYECVPQPYFYLPKTQYKTLLRSDTGYFSIRNLNEQELHFISENKCPIISIMKAKDKPYCITIGLHPKYISKTSVSNYINNIVCEYQHLL